MTKLDATVYPAESHSPATDKHFSTLFLRPWPVWIVTTLSALLLSVAYNHSFYHGLSGHLDAAKTTSLICFSLLLFLLNHLIISLLSGRRTLKAWLCTLFLLAALSSYFMDRYGVIIDREMLQNAIETDIHEVSGLYDIHLLWHLLLYFALPAVLVAKIDIRWSTQWQRRTLSWFSLVAISVLLIVATLASHYQLFSSVFRNYREVKHLATPFNTLDAVGSFLIKTYQNKPIEFKNIALDAHLTAEHQKPDLLVVVVGETARADHFSLNGYQRKTTPRLEKRQEQNLSGKLINFTNVRSCGTATAVSVPCMFSVLNRDDYDAHLAQNMDNLLDITQRAGIDTLWIDNNSGCKGVCERIPSFSIRECADGNCSDLQLVEALRNTLSNAKKTSRLVVLHQLGSHGPEYFKRSLPEQKVFMPECETNQFQLCERQSITNAYDNSILATDEMLDETIGLLSDLEESYNTAMLYVSDHGESLGEEGIYLHGLPYSLAPDSQKHVPMLSWLSTNYIEAHESDATCLLELTHQRLSHDDFFPSITQMLNIESEIFASSQSELADCLTR